MKVTSITDLYDLFLQHPVVSTDTRNLPEGCLFFALKGANFDGNRFAKVALEKGAAFAVVDDPDLAEENGCLYVENALSALQQLSNHHRKQLKIKVLGITGSNGKTSTKELIRDVLATTFNVLATSGNFNNHIGVPLTLLSIRDDHEIAIIEMGANGLHEIAVLSNIAEPDMGIITNIGKAHIEGFGSIQGIINTKKELYDFVMDRGGTIFVNKDDSLLMKLLNGYENILSYGTSEADTIGDIQAVSPFLNIQWGDDHHIETQLFGAYNLSNILAAICIGKYFEVPDSKINSAIASYEPANNRSQLVRTKLNTIYLDAYNANPTSMMNALESFGSIQASAKMVLLGDMLELGDQSLKEHQAIVDDLEKMDFTHVLLIGEEFSKTVKREHIHYFKHVEEASEWLKNKGFENYHVFIKGSRGIQLEKAVQAFD